MGVKIGLLEDPFSITIQENVKVVFKSLKKSDFFCLEEDLITEWQGFEIAEPLITLEKGLKIHSVGDDGVQTLQEFLRVATKEWGTRQARTLSVWLIFTAAALCEAQSSCFGTRAPLTRDFIKIGMVSYYGDTRRLKEEICSRLLYPTLGEGRVILRD